MIFIFNEDNDFSSFNDPIFYYNSSLLEYSFNKDDHSTDEIAPENYKITHEGKLHTLKFTEKIIIDPKAIAITSTSCILKLIDESKEIIEQESIGYDDIVYFLMVIMSYESEVGWIAHNQTVCSKQLKNLNNLPISMIEAEIEEELIRLTDKYDLRLIHEIIIKIS